MRRAIHRAVQGQTVPALPLPLRRPQSAAGQAGGHPEVQGQIQQGEPRFSGRGPADSSKTWAASSAKSKTSPSTPPSSTASTTPSAASSPSSNELKLDDNTVVIFTSDNGGLSTSEGTPTSNVPLRMGKGWNYEGGIREPLIIHWPGVTKPGSLSDYPTIGTDIYPTLLEIAGLAARPHQHLDGVSIAPLLRGQLLPGARSSGITRTTATRAAAPAPPSASATSSSSKTSKTMHAVLFNLKEDLGERNDLSQKLPDQSAALLKQLHAWQTSVDAAFPTPNPAYKPH